MGRIAVFVDAGYFWASAIHIIHGNAPGDRRGRDHVVVNYPSLRSEFLDEIKAQFPDCPLLRIYWYDGPSTTGGKTDSHLAIDDLDDFKLRLGTRNGLGEQKAVDGFIIADLIGLAQRKSITDALLISGDADLTPGVQAAQELGIRVHLLSLGSVNSTSPFLKAEVDQKKHWDDTTVKKFVSAAPVVAVPATPATPTPSAPATSAQEPAAQSATSQSAPLGNTTQPLVLPVHVLIANAATSFFNELPDKSIMPKSGAIPSALDKRLLTLGRKALGRSLTEDEKREIRNEARKRAS